MATAPAPPTLSFGLPAAPSTPGAAVDHYARANAALRLLDEQPDNADATLPLVTSYIALGLIGPARDLLSDERGPLAGRADVAATRRALATAPSGRIAWTSLEETFRQNIEALYRHSPPLRAFDDVFRSLPRRCELYRTVDGSLQLAGRGPGGRRTWIPDLFPSAAWKGGLRPAHDPAAQFCGNYVLVGDRFAILLEQLCASTARMFLSFSPRLFVLEPDARLLAAALFAAPLLKTLLEDRISFFVGEDCVEGLAGFLAARPEIDVPVHLLTPPTIGPRHEGKLTRCLQSILARRRDEARRVCIEVRELFRGRDGAWWAQRYARADREPLRVLGVTSRFTTVLQYSMRDLADAFRRRGHACEVLLEASDHDLLQVTEMARAVRRTQPDLIIVIDHHRAEYGEALPPDVPFVCWIQDLLPHLTSREAGRSLGARDFYIAPAMDQLVRVYDYPRERGLLWPVATNHTLYSNAPVSPAALERYRCDVSYVSNQSQTPEDFHESKRAKLSGQPLALAAIDRIRELLRDPATWTWPAARIVTLVQRHLGLRFAPESEDLLARVYIHPLTELLFRHDALAWAADYCDRTGRRLCLYGRGWESHPRFARYACGTAANGEELRAIYQASAINLQINSKGAIHQRLLDGLAAGGFFLIRYSPLDTLHLPIERTLAEFKRCGAKPDTTYPAEEMPALAEAVSGLAEWRGGHDPASVRISSAELAIFEELAGAQFRRIAAAVFREYERIRYRSADDFARLAEHYLAHPEERRALTEGMRRAVLDAFTYDALVGELVAFITDRLNRMANT